MIASHFKGVGEYVRGLSQYDGLVSFIYRVDEEVLWVLSTFLESRPVDGSSKELCF